MERPTRNEIDYEQETRKNLEQDILTERSKRKFETNWQYNFWYGPVPEGKRAYHIDGKWENMTKANLALADEVPGQWLDEDKGLKETSNPLKAPRHSLPDAERMRRTAQSDLDSIWVRYGYKLEPGEHVEAIDGNVHNWKRTNLRIRKE